MHITKAKEEDLYSILEMLKNSAIWLKGKGINYWQNWLNPPKEHIDWIKEGLEKNQFYFVEWNNEIIGVFRLQYEDEMFWGRRKEKAGYVHSFTIKRDKKLKGKGKEVLGDIEKYLVKNGIYLLRLDCGIEIDGLVKYYKNYGFKEKGEIEIHGEKLLLLEKACEVDQEVIDGMSSCISHVLGSLNTIEDRLKQINRATDQVEALKH